jgi:hypothetical protein
MRGNAWREGAAGLAVMVAAAQGASMADVRPAEASDSPRGVAPTLSGFTTAPVAEHSLRIRSGVGLQFRAPTSVRLATVHTFWRKAADHCEASLHADANGMPGELLVSTVIPDGVSGWVETPLDAPLALGSVYHAVFRCARSSSARLGYVLDADRTARDAGAWRIRRLHHARRLSRRAAPLFALRFEDGTWWGQPYRATRHRPRIRICARKEISATLVPTRSLVVTDVRLGGRRAPQLGFTLASPDGKAILVGPPDRATAAPAASSASLTLTPGSAYMLRLKSGRGHRHCVRQRALVTDLPVGPALAGVGLSALGATGDGGRTWWSLEATALSVNLVGTEAPLAGCGDGTLDPDEQCDGGADDACPGRCRQTCTCGTTKQGGAKTGPTCGDGHVDGGEACDGAANATCPGGCTAACTCAAGPARSYRAIYAGGYFGTYDGNTGPTVGRWPKHLGLIQGSADGQGPLVLPAKDVAAGAGNTDARFIFYSSLTSLDISGGFDADLYASFAGAHPDWILRDASGGRVSTFVPQLGAGVQIAVDIGNPRFVDAWADWALQAMDRWGWDGVFADNVEVIDFYGWAPAPVNPRTGKRYTTAAYRRDLLAALQQIRQRFDARGKILIGNHVDAWVHLDDAVVQQQVLAMHGVRIENCVFDWNASPLSEAKWISQLQYLDFANRRGVITQCQGVNGTIGDPDKRDYVLASALLTKEGFSGIAELNRVSSWWSSLDVDLGAPRGGYVCLDPAAGFAATAACPTSGKIFAREWQHGRVLVNPSATATVTVPLGETLVMNGNPVTSVGLGPRSGAILARP